MADEPWSVVQLVRFQQHIKKDFGVQDVVKLIYQANLGVEHFLDDSATVSNYLREEMASLDTASCGEALVERISTDDVFARVNLRPFLTLNLPSSLLVESMLESARETRPDTSGFFRQWSEFRRAVKVGLLWFSGEEVDRWESVLRSDGIRAVHHSGGYASANRPAYRVVRRTVFEQRLNAVVHNR